jgi:hypothetical protein
MMMSDKKKPSALIVAKLRPQPSEGPAPQSADGVESDDSTARQSAAEELLAAVEAKDAKAVAAAFSAMMELCESESEAPEASEAE